MDSYDIEVTAGMGTHYFSTRLQEFAATVGIPAPVFQGKRIYKEGAWEKWMIKTTIPGRTEDPEDQPMEYIESYTDWTLSVEVAMQGAIARIRHKYHEDIVKTSPYYSFGERTEDGESVNRGDSEYLSITHSYMTEREITSVNLENMLRHQIGVMDYARGALNYCNNRVVTVEQTCLALDDQRIELNDQLDASKKDNEELQKTIQTLRDNVEDEWMQKTQLEIKNGKLEEENEKLRQEVEKLKSGMASMTMELRDQDSQLKQRADRIAALEEGLEEEDPEERVGYDSDGKEVAIEKYKAKVASHGVKRRKPLPLSCLETIKRS